MTDRLYCWFFHAVDSDREPILYAENYERVKVTNVITPSPGYFTVSGTWHIVKDPDGVLQTKLYDFIDGTENEWLVKPLTGIEIARLKLEGLV